MFWDTKALKELDETNKHIEFLEKIQNEHDKKMFEIAQKIEMLINNKPQYLSAEEKERIADLEVKLKKLWELLTEKTPNNKDKLSRVGRRFGGQLTK